MKYIKIVFLLFTILLAGMAISSCGNKAAKTDTEKQGKEYTSAYICPMHCEGSGSAEPGTCPVCGMDYVKNEAHSFACSMHPEITGAKGEKCSKCGMDLTPISGDDHKGHNH